MKNGDCIIGVLFLDDIDMRKGTVCKFELSSDYFVEV